MISNSDDDDLMVVKKVEKENQVCSKGNLNSYCIAFSLLYACYS